MHVLVYAMSYDVICFINLRNDRLRDLSENNTTRNMTEKFSTCANHPDCIFTFD